MKPHSRIYVAGHRGMVGGAIVRALRNTGFDNLLLRTRPELDLLDGPSVEAFFAQERPEYVFLAAARVGGIAANIASPVEFLHENLSIQQHVMSAAHAVDVTKLMFLGSSCVYPREAPQPMREAALLTGPLEPTNETYALAKIIGLKACEAYRHQYGKDFVSVMPSNVYGPGDNLDPRTSHVVAGLITKLDEARRQEAPSVSLWGSGLPRRELLFVDDLADACVHLMRTWSEDTFINVGTGEDLTIAELAELVGEVVGYRGELHFDGTSPDGMPRKVMDVSRVRATGWEPGTSLRSGLDKTFAWFCEQ